MLPLSLSWTTYVLTMFYLIITLKTVLLATLHMVKLQFFTLMKHDFDDEILILHGQLHQKQLQNTLIHNPYRNIIKKTRLRRRTNANCRDPKWQSCFVLDVPYM